MSLTPEEIKEIKYNKRLGYAFSVAIIACGAIIILVYSQMERIDLIDVRILELILLTFGLSALVLYVMNRKLNKDLRFEERLVETKKIDKRKKIIDYEVGSGSLHIPFLGDLFPKIWGQEMKGYKKFRLTIDGENYDVEEELFNAVNEGDEIELHWSFYSEIFLGLKVKK